MDENIQNICNRNIDRLAIGLRRFICGPGAEGMKINHHQRARINKIKEGRLNSSSPDMTVIYNFSLALTLVKI